MGLFATYVEYYARPAGRRQGAEAAKSGILTTIRLSMTGARHVRSLHAIYVTDSSAVALSLAVSVTGRRSVTAPSGYTGNVDPSAATWRSIVGRSAASGPTGLMEADDTTSNRVGRATP